MKKRIRSAAYKARALARQRTLYHANLEKSRASVRERQKMRFEKDPRRILFEAARCRARRDSLEFDITIDDIKIPETCPIFGIKLSRLCQISAPSLDRIDNLKGYTRDNIAVISRRANAMKRDGTAEEHQLIADWIKQQ
jgi:hypothetical protein